MKTYYIYHVPGIKIGCTTNIKRRMSQQGFTNWEILEEHEDIYLASDRELELQTEYGYTIDHTPYYKTFRRVVNSNRGNTYTLGVKLSAETREKISEARKGKKFSAEHCKKISESHKGKTHSAETRKKMSETKRAKVTCTHCNKTGGISNMKRYHFDNCKHKKR